MRAGSGAVTHAATIGRATRAESWLLPRPHLFVPAERSCVDGRQRIIAISGRHFRRSVSSHSPLHFHAPRFSCPCDPAVSFCYTLHAVVQRTDCTGRDEAWHDLRRAAHGGSSGALPWAWRRTCHPAGRGLRKLCAAPCPPHALAAAPAKQAYLCQRTPPMNYCLGQVQLSLIVCGQLFKGARAAAAAQLRRHHRQVSLRQLACQAGHLQRNKRGLFHSHRPNGSSPVALGQLARQAGFAPQLSPSCARSGASSCASERAPEVPAKPAESANTCLVVQVGEHCAVLDGALDRRRIAAAQGVERGRGGHSLQQPQQQLRGSNVSECRHGRAAQLSTHQPAAHHAGQQPSSPATK